MVKQLGLNALVALIVKAASVLIILSIAIFLDANEYSKFGVYYAVITGVSVVVQSGALEIGATIGIGSKLLQRPAMQNLALVYDQLVLFLTILCVLPLVIIICFDEDASANNVTAVLACAIVGLSVSLGSIKSNLCRMIEDNYEAAKELSISALVTASGMLVGAIYTKSAVGTVYCSALFGFLSLVITRKINILDVITLNKINKSLDSVPLIKSIYINYLMISLLGWLGGYGINIATALLVDPSVVGVYTFIYTVTSALTMVAAIVNNIWLARFLNLGESKSSYRDDANKQVFIAEIIIAFTVGIFVLMMLRFFSTQLSLEVVKGLINKPIEIALLIATIIISIPSWQMQNYYTREGLAAEYRSVVVNSSVFALTVWIALMQFNGEFGVYVGSFVSALIKTKMLEKDFFARWHFYSLLKIALLASAALITTSLCIVIFFR